MVTKSGTIEFFNDECFRIFGDVQASRALSADNFSSTKELNSGGAVKDLIFDSNQLAQKSDVQFVYEKNPATKYYFSVRHSAITFNGQMMTAIILQDQTSFEELKRLDEKYQKIYLASVVHDIRTPLNGILGMLDVLEQYESRAQPIEYINAARNSAKLLLYYTHDITDYSAIESKTLSVLKEPFSPGEAMSECVKLLEFNFNRQGIALSTEVSEDMPARVTSDRIRYTQILLNLLGNALKFTPEGWVKILQRYSKEEDLLITSVEDSGIGIKEEDIPKLFKLFGMVRDRTELNPTGVGLGLTICRKLSEQLGGWISVQSTYGKGSTFTFSILCGIAQNNELQPEESDSSFSKLVFPEERASEFTSHDDSRSFFKLVHSTPMMKQSEESKVVVNDHKAKSQLPPPPEMVINQAIAASHKIEASHEAPLLIVDDNDYNILVLESFAKLSGTLCDIVCPNVAHI